MAWWDNILGSGGIGAMGFGQLPQMPQVSPLQQTPGVTPGRVGPPPIPGPPGFTVPGSGAGGNIWMNPQTGETSDMYDARARQAAMPQTGGMSNRDMMSAAMGLMQAGQPHPLGGGQAPSAMPPMGGPQQPGGGASPLMQYLTQMMQGRALGTQPSGNLWGELMRRQGYGM